MMSHRSRTLHGVVEGSRVVRRSRDSGRGSIGLNIPRKWYSDDGDNDAVVPPQVLLADLGVESDCSSSSDYGIDDSPLRRDRGARPSTHREASFSEDVSPTRSPTGTVVLQQKSERVKQLREKVEALALHERTRDNVTELVSLHSFDIDAKFRFLSRTFCQWLQLTRDNVIGHPLSSIVDPRDAWALRTILHQVVHPDSRAQIASNSSSSSSGDENATPCGGSTVHVRVRCGITVSHEASMTILVGSLGLIVVTRLYGV